MRRLFCIIAALSVSAAVICSCHKDEPAEIILGTPAIECQPEAGDYPISFTTNYEWTARSTVSWAQISQIYGEPGNVYMTLSVSEAEVNERSGQVIISCLDICDTIEVHQGQLDKMIIDRSEVLLASAGGTFDITVSTNVPYEIVIPASAPWLSVSTTKVYAAETVSFTCQPNDTYDNREADVLFASSASGIVDTLFVRQSQFDKIMLKEREVTMESAGGGFSVTVSSNIKYNVRISDEAASWIERVQTKGLVDESLDFSCRANESADGRSGRIYFTSEDGLLSDTLEVYQKQKDMLSISEHQVEFTSDGGDFAFEVEANVDYELVIPEEASSWLSKGESATKALTKNEMVISCAANADYDAREALLIVKSPSSGLADSLYVTQKQKDGLFVDADSVEVEAVGGKFSIALQYNVDYDISVDCDWLTRDQDLKMKSLLIKEYVFSASEYASIDEPRVGHIVFSGAGLSDTVTVTQNPVVAYTLAFGSTLDTLTVPAVSGENVYGRTDWGDGTVEDYADGQSHSYKEAGEHAVSVRVCHCKSASFPTIKGLVYIDLTGF